MTNIGISVTVGLAIYSNTLALTALKSKDKQKDTYKRQSLFEPGAEEASDEEINSVISKIMSRDEYSGLPIGPLPAPIDVRPQKLIYRTDKERFTR